MDLVPLLRANFGFPSFRENQEDVCRSVAEGRDVLLVMPTGAGKSLCYQLPALARGGTGLVVSPLIALMDDQAARLSTHGLRVARIHSGLSRDEARQACRNYLDGTLQFLFIAPERLRVPGFPEMLARRTPALIAIDEAHCISGWGHDFRPDYRTLGDSLPLLRPAPIIALTATATPAVQQDIVAQLRMADPVLYIHGFRRDNLAVEVVEMSKPRRPEFIAGFLDDAGRRPAIVYAPSRRAADDLALQLNTRFPAAAYHAGLDAGTRERVQRQFQAGELEVVVATIAFGMGIDKANVRTVIHAALPASVEAYYQEIGRAGRDGVLSRAVLLHSFADRRIHESFFERDYPPVEDLDRVARALTGDFQSPEPLAMKLNLDPDTFARAVEKLASQGAAQFDREGQVRAASASGWRAGYKAQLAHRRAQLEAMVHFAETPQCRMSALVRHFGDRAGASRPCGHCDFCSPHTAVAQVWEEPTAGEERDLRATLAALKTSPSIAAGRLFTEAAMGRERRSFDRLLDGLARAGWITLASETWTNPLGREVTYRRVHLTEEGRQLGGDEPLLVLLPAEIGAGPLSARKERGKGRAGKPAPGGAAAAPEFTPSQEELEARLRAWRKAEAAKAGKPAFFVFSDAILRSLVLAAPGTIPELRGVHGIGPMKAEHYGAAVCALCRGQDPSAV
ncbi:MAG TPA: ATP-dependent DNA helicase RecQ [Acidobacteriaceae bacterium]|jgi:ATP-dependent DNA helicase RecQ|nr:ATP-dependent DNA helicase RecQ [Acidobacteriaceae bacterium]